MIKKRMNHTALRRIDIMKFLVTGFLLLFFVVAGIGCAPADLPESSRVGNRRGSGNSDLRLPSQLGSKPSDRSRWWDRGESQYPNSGYYSSERR